MLKLGIPKANFVCSNKVRGTGKGLILLSYREWTKTETLIVLVPLQKEVAEGL